MAEQNQRSERDLILMRAALMRQDTNKADAYLERILAQVDGHESRATRALVWAGKLDAAAELFIRRLSDPRLRGNALLAAQVRHESVPLSGDALYRDRWRALLEREDVQAAIKAVGRVQSYAVW